MRDRIAERVMLAEVHLRNLIAKYTDMNEREYKVAGLMPEVGIFWMSKDGKKFYKDSVSMRDAEDYGDYKMYSTSHYKIWPKAQGRIPSWKGKEYEDVPRGRIVLNVVPGKNRFIVYLPKELAKHSGKIPRAFGIPSNAVEFDYSDPHYRMRKKRTKQQEIDDWGV